MSTDGVLDQKMVDSFFDNMKYLKLTLEDASKMLKIPLSELEHLKLQYDLAHDQANPE